MSYADADPLERAVAFLTTHAGVLTEFNGVSSEVEAPYPHLRVVPSDGGTVGDMRWQHSAGVQVEAIGDPSGWPGRAELRRKMMVAVKAMGELVDQEYSAPSDIVVTFVSGTSSVVWSPLEEGNPRWLVTFEVGVRPGLE